MSDALPPALLARLRSDAKSFEDANSSSSISDATSSGRSFAARRLLSLTPKAISTVDRVMSSQNDKDALAAATLVLSKSPATRDEQTLLGDSALSSSLVSALSGALSGFAAAFASLAPARPADAPREALDQETLPIEPVGFQLDPDGDLMQSEPLPLASIPPSSGTAQLTAFGLSELVADPAPATQKPIKKARKPRKAKP